MVSVFVFRKCETDKLNVYPPVQVNYLGKHFVVPISKDRPNSVLRKLGLALIQVTTNNTGSIRLLNVGLLPQHRHNIVTGGICAVLEYML